MWRCGRWAPQPAEWLVRTFAGVDFAWKDSIRDFRVEEALYDGNELTLKYSVEAPGCDLAYGDELLTGPNGAETVDNVPCIVDAMVVEDPEQIIDIESAFLDDMMELNLATPEQTHRGERTISEHDNGRLTLTSVFDIGEVSPTSDLVLLVFCDNGSRNSEGKVHFDLLGFLQTPLQLDLRHAPARHAASQTFMVQGVPIEITEAVLRPTGLRVDFMLRLSSWAENLDFQVYVDGRLVTPDNGEQRASICMATARATRWRDAFRCHLPEKASPLFDWSH